jgi:hypothetical protein
MPALQRDFVLKYYWAGQGGGDGPQWRGTTNDKIVQRMMKAAMKRAQATRAMMMVMRMAGEE